jgi:hypothetical protein
VNRDLQRAFSERFRRVSNRYPRTVSYAYGRDLSSALAASDDEVRAKVREWEIAQGYAPRDWYATGRAEGRDDSEIR